MTPPKKPNPERIKSEIMGLIEEKAAVADFLGKTTNPTHHNVFTDKYVELERKQTVLVKQLQMITK